MQFFFSGRHIIQVNLKKLDLQEEIDDALRTSQCAVGRGSSRFFLYTIYILSLAYLSESLVASTVLIIIITTIQVI